MCKKYLHRLVQNFTFSVKQVDFDLLSVKDLGLKKK